MFIRVKDFKILLLYVMQNIFGNKLYRPVGSVTLNQLIASKRLLLQSSCLLLFSPLSFSILRLQIVRDLQCLNDYCPSYRFQIIFFLDEIKIIRLIANLFKTVNLFLFQAIFICFWECEFGFYHTGEFMIFDPSLVFILVDSTFSDKKRGKNP